ncbi:MAG: FHA domain-containing protein [Candidatus Brocadiia bacterium]
MHASLYVRRGPLSGTVFPVYRDCVTLVGRAASNHIVLGDAQVSAHHCVLAPSREGSAVSLVDARSRSGVVVNGEAMTKGEVAPGDIIHIGPFELELVEAESGPAVSRAYRPRKAGPPRFAFGRLRRPKAMVLAPGSATVLGRGPLAHIRLDSPFVSEFHSMLALDPTDDGRMPFLIDLYSSNGTFVNGQPVHRKHVLPGDAIVVGRAHFGIRRVEPGERREPGDVDEAERPEPPPRRITTTVLPPASRVPLPEEQAPPASEEATELIFDLPSQEPADHQGLGETQPLDAVPSGRRPAPPESEAARLLAEVPRDYGAYYGFRERPFGPTADPEYFFHSRCHWEALASLMRWVRRGPPLALLFGQTGCGKSLLLACVERRLAAQSPPPVVLRPGVPPAERDQLIMAAVARVAERCGDLACDAQAPVDLWNAALAELGGRGIRLVVLVDDAHALSAEALQAMGDLLEHPAARDNARLVLAGDETLRQVVAVPPLSYHLGVSCYLAPLSLEEVAGYVAHHLGHAAPGRRLVFTRRAVELISAYSHGVPRLINTVADAALFYACRDSRQQVSHEVVSQAIQEGLDGELPPTTA